MKTNAKVIRTKGNIAWVSVCHGEYCAGYGLHSANDKRIDVAARNTVHAKTGDRVELSSDEGRMVRTVFLVFWFPLAVAGLFAWMGHEISVMLAWNGLPVLSVALGLVGFALSIIAVYLVGKRTEAGTGLTVTRVIPDREMTFCRSGLFVEQDPAFLEEDQ